MPTPDLRLFGIRHHGPRSNASLVAALEAISVPPTTLLVFETQEIQEPNYNALPKPAATGTRQMTGHQRPPLRLLSWRELLPTPAHVRDRISTQQVALWQLANWSAWAVSTQNHTVLIGQSSLPKVDLVTIHPAKGGGEMRLYIGKLALYDHYRSSALELLAAALAENTNLSIRKSESHDC